MALPNDIEQTVQLGQPIPASLIMAIQVAIVVTYARVVKLEQPVWIPLHLGRTDSANWSIGTSGKWSSIGGGDVVIPITPILSQRTLTEVKMVYVRGGGTTTLRVYSVDAAGVNTEEATFSDTTTLGTVETHDFSLSVSTTDKTFYCVISGGASGTELRAVRFTH